MCGCCKKDIYSTDIVIVHTADLKTASAKMRSLNGTPTPLDANDDDDDPDLKTQELW